MEPHSDLYIPIRWQLVCSFLSLFIQRFHLAIHQTQAPACLVSAGHCAPRTRVMTGTDRHCLCPGASTTHCPLGAGQVISGFGQRVLPKSHHLYT